MERVVQMILDLFDEFEVISYQFGSGGEKITHSSMEEIPIQYSHKLRIIERQLNEAYLSGNDIMLTRLRTELLAIRDDIRKLDFMLGLENGDFKELMSIKLFYIEKTVRVIDNRLPLIEILPPQKKEAGNEPAPRPEPDEESTGITLRVQALVYDYQIKANIVAPLTREQMRTKGGKALEKAFDTINPRSTTHIKPKEKELRQVVELLSKYPLAQKVATSDLDMLQNS